MTIKEVSEKYNLSTDTLRYYEKEGLVGPVKKTQSGIRDYSEKDLQRISFVKCMRGASVSIEVLKKYIALYDKGDKTKEERKRLLEEQREILKEKIEVMQQAYDKLNYKIEYFYGKNSSKYR